MKPIKILVGLLVVGTVLNSSALTLGRVRGAAWIGQPLSLSIAVQMDSTVPDAGLCADVEVFYADSKQDPSRVQVQQEPTAQADTRILQVTSATTIDEPMVTVYLRVGCGQKISRRYVLLADYPSIAAVVEPQAIAAAAAAVAVDTPMLVTPSGSAPVTTNSAPAAAPTVARNSAAPAPGAGTPPGGTRATARLATDKKPVLPKPAVAAAPTKPAASPGTNTAPPTRARLKLDPLENLAERIKTLETTTTSIPLDELVRDSQRMQQLQSDVKALLQQAAKNEATLAALRERLEKAESDRVSATLLYGLVALVLLCLAAVAVLWNRRNPPNVWRQDWPEPLPDHAVPPGHTSPASHSSPASKPATLDPTAPIAVPPVLAARPTVVPHKAAPSDAALDVDLIEMDSVSYGKLMHPSPTEPAPLGLMTNNEPLPQPLLDSLLHRQDFNSEGQFDLRQQAEFFEQLDKTDEAIEALERRIRANGKDCPLVYLELLRIANAHSLKTDYRQFRDECQQVFNVQIPEFAMFRNEGRGLEAHPSLLKHIEKLWPSSQVLDVIESCILRDPWEKNAEPFDLAAFKELVLLHGIAYRLTQPAAHTGHVESLGSDGVVDSQRMDLEL